ncbi:MAG TPA: pilus assembly protein N-terminal domain-containing protein [Caulobacteraceae bacterium]|nr:pilus assembly protein N-terminal domain-containing protein [Caulobacteraceae bacterium]
MFLDRPIRLVLAAAGGVCVLAALPHAASAQAFSVPLSESRPLSLPGSASDVLVGDPAIADVTVVDHHHILVHGKMFGRTNLVVMDGAGRTLFSGPIVVSAADEDHVSLFRGSQQSEYSCSTRCERISGAAAGAGGAASGGGGASSAPAMQSVGNAPPVQP